MLLKNPIKSHFYFLIILIGISTMILFSCSVFRHLLFQSAAFDLGIFDNALYLISQGQRPFVVFKGIHILGDHAAYLLYPLALFYKIYPSVYWLFLIQAIALSLGALPTSFLATDAGLKPAQALAVSIVYLFYPLVFNINLFDFHPEVLAIPLILWTILNARRQQWGWFCFSLFLALGCKAVISLAIAAMGFWLLIFEKRRWYGILALIAGLAWFIIATKIILPKFGVPDPQAIIYYQALGGSFSEIFKNIFLKPGVVLKLLLTSANFEYLLLLFIPVIWGISRQNLAPLIPTLPILFLNGITTYSRQKDLIHQYSVPILPFLIVAVVASLATGKSWFRKPRWIILWALVAFLALSKYGYLWSKYLGSLDTWQANQEALALIQTQNGVLTTDALAPHLTHRQVVQLVKQDIKSMDLSPIQYILLNIKHPGGDAPQHYIDSAVVELQKMPDFQLRYQRDKVFLFEKIAHAS